MEKIKRMLEERENQLIKIKKEREKSLVTAPEGALRISCNRNKIRYYQRNNPKDLNGTYLKEKDFHIAQKLAQKEYDQKILRVAQKELNAIEKYLANYPEKNVEQVYENLHRERQKLIIPIMEPEEEYVNRWKNVKYTGKVFFEDVAELYTAKGERVRSKSEIIIADLLDREGIPYRYEYPIRLKGMGTIYPDFTVLNVQERKEILWEHLGMMDDPAYVENAIKKIEMYEQNGIYPGKKLILTYETKKNPINPKQIKAMIQHYFK